MKNDKSLREDYLIWVEPQLGLGQPETYWGLVNLMFDQEFRSDLMMDHNRLNDGVDIRAEFSRLTNTPRADMLELNPVSFLEVLLGLSRRMAFVAGGAKEGWARQLIINLEFDKARDPLTRFRQNVVLKTMDRVINRSYEPSGLGGFFPLSWPDRDQRTVELWHQLNAYVEELHPGN